MKKIFFAFTLLLFSAVTALAVPARPGQWKTITLADGRQVMVELKGDEYTHYYESKDGELFMCDYATGTYSQLTRAELMKHAKAVRLEVENELAAKQQGVNGKRKIRVIGAKHDPYIGKKKCLCVLINFSDEKFKEGHDLEMYKQYINGKDYTNPELGKVMTVHEYFQAQSNGLFEVDFDVVGPYTMPNIASYYGGNLGGQRGSDRNVQNMIKTALNMADPEVNFADYDWDGDGYCEAIFFLYCGLGEADGGDSDDIWPHKGTLNTFSRMDGVYISDYACSCELRRGGVLAGIGTMCHEYSHCLGFPDLYDTEYSGVTGMGYWDVMESGCYQPDNTSTNPVGYSGYERWYAGWINPIELSDTEVNVTDAAPLTQAGLPYIIYNQNDRDEYYMLECRKREGVDASLPGEGLLVYHIDFDATAWAYGLVNSPTKSPLISNHPRFQLLSSGGTYGSNAVYPSVVNTISNITNPAATLYNPNTDGTRFLNRTVANIRRNSDGTCAFNYLPTPLEQKPAPENAVFYESFDRNFCSGGNDGDFAVNATLTVATDNDDWKLTAGASYAASQCALFGKSSSRGIAQTPALQLDGKYTLTFRAAPFASECKTVSIGAAPSTGATFDVKQFAITPGQWTECKAEVEAHGSVALQFYSNAKRFYLDEVLIVSADGGADGITEVVADGVSAASPAYNAAGQRVAATAKGLVIVNGKKVINK